MNIWVIVLVTVWFLIMSVCDLKSCRVPVWLLGIGCATVALITVCQCASGMKEYSVMIYGTIPGLFILLLAFLTELVGYGDGVALVAIGGIIGWRDSVLILAMGLLLAAVCSVVMLVSGKAGRKTQIPFLPFLTVAWILVEVI